MHIVRYSYTHPINIMNAVEFTLADNTIRDAFVAYATQNGLLTTETRLLSDQSLVHEAVWTSEAAWTAAKVHAGQEYADWVLSIKNRIEAGGGTYLVEEQTTI